MPVIHITVARKLEKDVKREIQEYFAEQICKNTSTVSKNIYVYIHETEPENCPNLLLQF